MKSQVWVPMGLIFGVLSGCASGPRWSSVGGRGGRAPEAELRSRVEAYWAAKQKEDWDALFEFQEPQIRRETKQDRFVAWSESEAPMRVHSFEVSQVQAEGEFGWAYVPYRASVRRFKDIPPRDVYTWQKWRLVDGEWYPVEREDLLPTIPEAPATRDAGEEKRLRERYEQTWQARVRRDWERVYQFSDPRDHGIVDLDDFAESEALFEYIRHDVYWVQVIGDNGKIRVNYHHKVTDPSLTNLPSQDLVVVENWIKVDGEWYRDLKR